MGEEMRRYVKKKTSKTRRGDRIEPISSSKRVSISYFVNESRHINPKREREGTTTTAGQAKKTNINTHSTPPPRTDPPRPQITHRVTAHPPHRSYPRYRSRSSPSSRSRSPCSAPTPTPIPTVTRCPTSQSPASRARVRVLVAVHGHGPGRAPDHGPPAHGRRSAARGTRS